jgi:hypothetical protein
MFNHQNNPATSLTVTFLSRHTSRTQSRKPATILSQHANSSVPGMLLHTLTKMIVELYHCNAILHGRNYAIRFRLIDGISLRMILFFLITL